MLYYNKQKTSRFEANNLVLGTGAEYGNLVTGSGSINTKGSYTPLILASTYTAYGISIILSNTSVASTRTGILVDIAVGGAGSEQIIINNLLGGYLAPSGTAEGIGGMYHFPLRIPAGTRVSARCQGFNASDTVNVDVRLHENPTGPGGWWGTRVTSYGANTSQSTGVSISPGNGAYVTGTIIASTTAPLKYMQLGTDLFTNTAGTTARGLIQIQAASQIVANNLPYSESTTTECVGFAMANFLLSQMSFNLASGINLTVGAMRNTAAATRGFMLYGVD